MGERSMKVITKIFRILAIISTLISGGLLIVDWRIFPEWLCEILIFNPVVTMGLLLIAYELLEKER